jgi:hypothetical protein
MTIRTDKGVSYITSDSLFEQGVPHGFFMRHGGCSPAPWISLNMATSVGDSRENVIENRERIASSLGIASDRFFDVWQVHGKHVVSAENPRLPDQIHIQADAIITAQPNVFLLMLFADCVPIMLYDRIQRVAGIAHAGWKGTLNNVIKELVVKMDKDLHVKAGDIQAVIGPCICQTHYQVGDDVALPAKEIYENEAVLIKRSGFYYFDLGLANMINLQRLGISRIERLEICTFCQKEDWFSHRGENGKTGRFAAVIGLPG